MLTCTTKDLAVIYGCSVQYIGEMVKNGDLPKPIRQNCHDVVKACQAMFEKVREESADNQSNLAAEKLRLTKAQARKAELEVLEITKILVPAKDVREAAFEKARLLRDQLLNIPNRIAPILAAERDSKKSHTILDKELRQCLESIAGDLNESNLQVKMN